MTDRSCDQATSAGTMVEPTDDVLAHEVGHGDVDFGMRALERRYGRRLRHFTQRIVGDPSVAEDLAQDVLETVYLKNHLYMPGTSFRAWLFEIARNRALSALRKQKLRPRPTATLPTRADGHQADPLDLLQSHHGGRELEEAEMMACLETALAALPKKYEQVFRLCVQQGRSYQDVGRSLRIPTSTVAIRIMRARQRLYEMLKHHIGRVRRPPACIQ